MAAFAFQFYYETPEQRTANKMADRRRYSCQWIVIDAPDEDAAVAWGYEVAEQFLILLR